MRANAVQRRIPGAPICVVVLCDSSSMGSTDATVANAVILVRGVIS